MACLSLLALTCLCLSLRHLAISYAEQSAEKGTVQMVHGVSGGGYWERGYSDRYSDMGGVSKSKVQAYIDRCDLVESLLPGRLHGK